MRIYRHDKEWLKNQPPFVKTNVDTNNRVDWTKRDLQILAKVKVAVEGFKYQRKACKNNDK
ncbi:TnsD family Tn7-like transposition protein [Lysinibacillus fusiformis]|uniref:TnsD family Tn7-like transposition protein n=1 Tax=Lysinibacillus fusiformis TaxID=28031 RepID=UPI00119C9702|nr:TnsD family Tn7-like transposition protein [Lysinibacillus fusiformis]